MILIICDTNDESAILVYNTILRKGIKCKIINSNDFFEKFTINYFFENKFIDIKEKKNGVVVTGVWIKKFDIVSNRFSSKNSDIDFILENEFYTLCNFIFDSCRLNILSNYCNLKISKLQTLSIASEIGLSIPKSYIINSKNDLIYLVKKNRDLIIKNSFENLSFQKGNKYYQQFTEILSIEKLYKIKKLFFPIFLQKRINKIAEIRSFYINGKLFSIATFSSVNEIDIKKRNGIQRHIPFVIPIETQEKIIILVKKLNINIGAIDFILNENYELIFLEINPNGNFRIVSEFGNYNLEEIVANELINYEKKY